MEVKKLTDEEIKEWILATHMYLIELRRKEHKDDAETSQLEFILSAMVEIQVRRDLERNKKYLKENEEQQTTKIMPMFYVSHPYTGNEAANMLGARQIVAALQAKYPDVHFYNPLDALVAQGMAGLNLEVILLHCANMITKCDGVILTGNWETSYGCREEKKWAEAYEIPVFQDVKDFTTYWETKHSNCR